MHEVYSGHGMERVECCNAATPCAYHARFPDAVRSPHLTVDMQMTTCAECAPAIRGLLETATS